MSTILLRGRPLKRSGLGRVALPSVSDRETLPVSGSECPRRFHRTDIAPQPFEPHAKCSRRGDFQPQGCFTLAGRNGPTDHTDSHLRRGGLSSLWRQIHADVFNREVITVSGSARGRAYGRLLWPAPASGSGNPWQRPPRSSPLKRPPDRFQEHVTIYHRLFPIYSGLYKVLKEKLRPDRRDLSVTAAPVSRLAPYLFGRTDRSPFLVPCRLSAKGLHIALFRSVQDQMTFSIALSGAFLGFIFTNSRQPPGRFLSGFEIRLSEDGHSMRRRGSTSVDV